MGFSTVSESVTDALENLLQPDEKGWLVLFATYRHHISLILGTSSCIIQFISISVSKTLCMEWDLILHKNFTICPIVTGYQEWEQVYKIQWITIEL